MIQADKLQPVAEARCIGVPVYMRPVKRDDCKASTAAIISELR